MRLGFLLVVWTLTATSIAIARGDNCSEAFTGLPPQEAAQAQRDFGTPPGTSNHYESILVQLTRERGKAAKLYRFSLGSTVLETDSIATLVRHAKDTPGTRPILFALKNFSREEANAFLTSARIENGLHGQRREVGLVHVHSRSNHNIVYERAASFKVKEVGEVKPLPHPEKAGFEGSLILSKGRYSLIVRVISATRDLVALLIERLQLALSSGAKRESLLDTVHRVKYELVAERGVSPGDLQIEIEDQLGEVQIAEIGRPDETEYAR